MVRDGQLQPELRLDVRRARHRRQRLQPPFGRIYDSNTVGRVGGAPEASGVGLSADNVVSLAMRGLFAHAGGLSDEAKHDCLLGQRCYSTAFKISTAGCVLAFGLSVVAGFRRERQKRRR